MKTVQQVSRLTGVSVRTLHHYDAIGLLKPSQVTPAGYRMYDEKSLAQLQTILLLRQLRFSLKDIKKILDNPQFDPIQAMTQQIRLLELQRDQLDRLIAHARKIQETGVMEMNFSAFDTKQLDEYTAQAKNKWGSTDAYKQFEKKTQGQSKEQLLTTGDALMDIFREAGTIRHLSPASPEGQALVAKLQNFITEHYYNCTNQILRGLGQMYIAGDSMTENIEKAGGEGTAQFVHQAIEVFTK